MSSASGRSFQDCSEGLVEIFRFAYVMQLQLYSHRLSGVVSLFHRRNMKTISEFMNMATYESAGVTSRQKLEPFAFEVWCD